MGKLATFSRDELREALELFARKLGERRDLGEITQISLDENDDDFFHIEIESIALGTFSRRFAKTVIGAALIHFREERNEPLSGQPKRVSLNENSEITLFLE